MCNTTTNKRFVTGGILNRINELYKCNSKHRSVPVMSLIRHHQPKTNAQLAMLIEVHQANREYANCPCGCRSAGTVKDFGKNLYDAQLDYFNKLSESERIANNFNEVFTLEHCELFMYTLFITNSLRGNNMETKAQQELNRTGKVYHKLECASEELDFKYAVDLIAVNKENKAVCGVQVKPATYQTLREDHEVKVVSRKKNAAWGMPVFYLYYSNDMQFTNLEEVITKLNDHIKMLELVA